jgi:bifunctional non-homologous end joining protein LigD
LTWKEVKDKLDPAKFTMDTLAERLEKKGDLFENLLNEKWRSANTIILRQLL